MFQPKMLWRNILWSAFVVSYSACKNTQAISNIKFPSIFRWSHFQPPPKFRIERLVFADDSSSFVSWFVSGSSDSNLCRLKCCQFLTLLLVTDFLCHSSTSVLGQFFNLYPKSPLHNSKLHKERYLRAILCRHTFPRATLVVLIILLCLRNLMSIFSPIADWTGREGDLIPVEARFSAPVKTQDWGPPSLLYIGYRFISGG
jgi:hypothetical protein